MCVRIQFLYNVYMCHVGMHVVRCGLHIILNECDCVYMCASSVPVQCTWHVRGYEMHWLYVYEVRVHACTMDACLVV